MGAASVGDSDGIHAKAHFVKNELNNTVDWLLDITAI